MQTDPFICSRLQGEEQLLLRVGYLLLLCHQLDADCLCHATHDTVLQHGNALL